MPLTQEEQDIMNGSKGEALAKIMKIVVAHGNAFGAEKLVDLGGRPHCSLYTGTDYMGPMIKLFDECAKAGLKTYAPYTVNPRCYDLYNVNNNATDMRLIYEGYRLQRDLDWVHARLGAPDLNFRSCACYVDEIGNAPPHRARLKKQSFHSVKISPQFIARQSPSCRQQSVDAAEMAGDPNAAAKITAQSKR